MPARLAFALNRFLRRFGYEVRRYDASNPGYQARTALGDPRIRSVIDVGANVGQYATSIRSIRPDVAIHSFEPLPDAYRKLAEASSESPDWHAHPCALGRTPGRLPMMVAGNSESSSLLTMHENHLNAAPESRTIGTVEVEIRTLDSFADVLGDGLFLKVDAQGYEGEVLAGAREVLARTIYIQLEVSMAPLYEGAPPAWEIIRTANEAGFDIHTITPVFSDRARSRLLQADFLFSRMS